MRDLTTTTGTALAVLSLTQVSLMDHTQKRCRTMSRLTTHLVEVARRNLGAFLPWSPLTGLGQASELAAQHPAFATDRAPEARVDA